MWALQHISRLIFSQTECLIMLIFAVLVVCNEYLEDLVLINLSSMTMILKIQLKITKIIIGQLSIIGCLHRLSIVCHFNTNIDFKLIVANHVPFLVYFKLHIIFKVISIWFHVCNSFCVSIKHITLICQHDKLPLVYYFFLYEFCSSIISKIPITMNFKFSQHLCHYQESKCEAFQCDQSTMTSSRRHFVFSRYHWYLHIHSS